MRKYRINQKLEVSWTDVVEDADWVEEKDMVKRPKGDFNTLGYYHHHDKEFLYLSGTVGVLGRNKMTIPLGIIKKIKIQADK